MLKTNKTTIKELSEMLLEPNAMIIARKEAVPKMRELLTNAEQFRKVINRKKKVLEEKAFMPLEVTQVFFGFCDRLIEALKHNLKEAENPAATPTTALEDLKELKDRIVTITFLFPSIATTTTYLRNPEEHKVIRRPLEKFLNATQELYASVISSTNIGPNISSISSIPRKTS